jgi:hypothetical protein
MIGGYMPSESREYTFFGVQCKVFRAEREHPFPWRFVVIRPSGTTIFFIGVPNQCETWRSAMMRARARCRWIADGTYDQRYR